MVLTVAGALASAAAAQNQYDALRFLGNDVNGTARFVGMGGAMSSLGGRFVYYWNKPCRHRTLQK